MSAGLTPACPVCDRELTQAEQAWNCAACARAWPIERGVLDLREPGLATIEDPWPWTRKVAEQALSQLCAGAEWKTVFESALLALDDERADHLMLLTREARAAWLVLLNGEPGPTLCIGNASSGAAIALARAGHRVVLVDRSLTRLELGLAQARGMASVEASAVCVGERSRLPFCDGAFDLVLQEQGLPQARTPWNYSVNELARVCRVELVQSANNRLGYKRSRGRRGDFAIPSPLEYFKGALFPAHGERSLRGYRAALWNAKWEHVRAFALYPHLSDFTHLVNLDRGGPTLMLGPKERRNRPKILATSLGLFPWLTPSFAFLARKKSAAARPATRLDRVLDDLAAHIGEPRPDAEFVHATRGNSTLVFTHMVGRGEADSQGRWVVHVPLSEQQRVQLIQHHARLSLVREKFGAVAVPQPLWIGESNGLTIACERRLPGISAPQFTGDHAVAKRMFADVARDFSTLTMRQPQVFDAADFERLVAARFALVARFAAVPATVERLAVLCESMRAVLVGARLPLVLHHSDLRSKHIQIRPDGSVIGYLDWGSSETEDLPYFDVLHMIVHERKHEAGLSAAAAWRIVRERGELRDYEQRALDDYSERIGIDEPARRAIEAIYPVIVAGMAERNWDYSRPRWLARQFGI